MNEELLAEILKTVAKEVIKEIASKTSHGVTTKMNTYNHTDANTQIRRSFTVFAPSNPIRTTDKKTVKHRELMKKIIKPHISSGKMPLRTLMKKQTNATKTIMKLIKR